MLREKILYYVLPLFFTAYLLYGFVRPRILARLAQGNRGGRRRAGGGELTWPKRIPSCWPALAGFFCGLIFSSIPVGPINLTILNEGAQRGFVWALLIGLGASAMETIYCAFSFTGFSSLFDHGIVQAFMQVFSFVFILFIGFKFLLAKTVHMPTKLDAASEKIEARIEQKFHPHSAFMTGFVRVMGNLGVLLFWMVLAANLMTRDWVDGRFSCRQGRVRRRRRARHEHLVLCLEFRRVARPRTVQRKDAAAPAAFLRHLPHHFRPPPRHAHRAGTWPGTAGIIRQMRNNALHRPNNN